MLNSFQLSLKYAEQENRPIDLETESFLIEELLGNRVQPIKWKKTSFNPSENISDALELFRYIYPEVQFKLSFTGDRFHSVSLDYGLEETAHSTSKNAARSLFLLALYLHNDDYS